MTDQMRDQTMDRKELEIYIHIPFCVRKCAYCDFLSFYADDPAREDYVSRLLMEIHKAGEYCKDYEVSTVYLGGGTPSLLDSRMIVEIMDTLRTYFCIRDDAEVSIEANPGTLTPDKLDDYRKAGINRLSIGLQSADDEELKVLGRIHTYDEFLESYHAARKHGFDNINVDLMSALPGQSVGSWEKTLRTVAGLEPEHISAYSLIIEEGTPFFEKYGSKEGSKLLPDEDSELEIYHLTREILEGYGYDRYEISNYAKRGKECRHNIGYWTGAEYLGLGLGASSFFEGKRFKNTDVFEEYFRADFETDPGSSGGICREIEVMTKKALEEEFFFLGLRMCEGVSLVEFERRFGESARNVYPGLMEKLNDQRLAVLSGDRFYLTDFGLDVSNYVMAQFLQD